jgi:hypothetical protein
MLVLAGFLGMRVLCFGLEAGVEGALRFLVDGATCAATSGGSGAGSASVSFVGTASAAVCVSRSVDDAVLGCCFALAMVIGDEGRVGSGRAGLGWGWA